MPVICYFVLVRFIYSIWSFYYQVLVFVYKEKKIRQRKNDVVYLVFVFVFIYSLHILARTYNATVL